MHCKFQMSMMRELKFFLGIQIHQPPRGIFINQAKYAQEILIKHGMTSYDSISTPMATKHLDADLSGTSVDQTKYHSMVGALMYLTTSRPDIVHATCYCVRYQARSTEKHLTAVKQIFRYLKNTINMGLCWAIQACSLEVDVAGGDKLVSWSSKKQDCTSMSSAEAEYAAIAISCNPVQHSRTKHIDVRYHFIKEQVKKGIVELFFVITEYQLTDLFTKALPEDRFKYLVRRLGMRCLTPEELEASATTTAKRCLVENVSSGLVPQGKKASDYRQTLTTLTQDKMLFLTTEKKIRSTGLEFLLQSLLEEYYNPTTNKLRKKQNIDQTGCIVFNEDEFINLFMIPVQDNWWSLLNATFDNTVCGIHFNHKVMITMDQSHPLETSSWKSNHAVQTSRQPLPQICKSSKGTDSGEGIDFEESFAQFDRLEAVVRIFVAPRSTQKGWVRCPDHPERSLPLRSFYGLKQAQESWPTYALEILKKHNMDNCHSIGTPLATKPKLDVDLSGEPVDQSDYRSKIGSLMYLTSSRPDLVQAWYAMCTLSSTANTKASKEDCTAMSSAEAEYVALSTSYAQVMWMRTQLKDYGSTTTKYRVLFDSSVSHSISMQPVTTSYEHSNIHTRYHFIGNRLGNINPMIQPESEDLPWIIQKLEIAESLEHPSDTNVFTMKMEILLEPASNKLLVVITGSYIQQHESVNDAYLEEQGDTNITIDSLIMSTHQETVDQDDDDLANERDLLASLIEKLKCEIVDNKNRNKFLESSNKDLVDKLKGEIEDFKTKNKSLETSNNHFKEANNELSKTNQWMFKDLKKFQAELDRYHVKHEN
ncbi:hypothetical protein Tco_0151081 [Tanacetum coccineum]